MWLLRSHEGVKFRGIIPILNPITSDPIELLTQINGLKKVDGFIYNWNLQEYMNTFI